MKWKLQKKRRETSETCAAHETRNDECSVENPNEISGVGLI
jgi:hypothetical protein